jgi:dihydrolipoamide dehydrogenase
MAAVSNETTKDLIVLGSGPGGYIAAIRAAQLGRKVTIVEREALGGVCLNWGCIPSKALLKSAQLYQSLNHASEFGFTAEKITLDFPKVVERSREVSGKLSGGVGYLMKKNKIEVILGTGVLERGKVLKVTSKEGKETIYSFNDIIIATGARPRTIPGIEIDGEVIHTYRTILEYKKLPKKTLIIGGGVIGVEFAYFHSSFGTDVTIVEMMDQILPLEDSEVAQGLERSFKKRGLKVHTGSKVISVKRGGTKANPNVTVTLELKGGKTETWEGDCCLCAVGVVPNIENLGLENVGIETSRGGIKVDQYLRTSLPNYWAIGDVIGAPQLAHVASHEGVIAAENACANNNSHLHLMRYDNVPSCTYCQPQVASIGDNEQTLKSKGIKYRVGKIPFSAIGKAIAIGEQEGFIKVLIDDSVGEVLGVHILHSEATELIAEAGIIRSHEGIAASVVETIHAHPTLSEGMMEAMALALGRPLNF